MPGGISYDPGSVPLARPSATLAVYRYVPDAVDPQPRYELLPNVRCVGIERPKDGGDPGAARFRYTFVDVSLAPDDPRRIEDVYPYDATGPRVVRTDDRLVVRAFRDDGASTLLFDGFAQVPQADLDAETEAVTFAALGTPVRERDTPLGGALVRDGDQPDITSDYETALPARFNPDGHPNASPEGADAELGNGTGIFYPTFLGPFWPSNEVNGQTVRPWFLGMAARYVICRGNPDREWVTYDKLSYLDSLLVAYEPTDPEGTIDILDPATYTTDYLEVQDIDVTGSAWPEALVRLLEPHGFGFRFVLEEDEIPEDADPGTLPDPKWTFRVFRKDTQLFPKDLHLQVAGGSFDPAQTNLGALSLARDNADIANRVVVDSAPVRVEASFVLAPLFEVAAGDASNLGAFVKNDTTSNPLFIGANVYKYRLYGFDECGEGHWDFGTAATVTTAGDFAKALNFGAKKRPWAKRRRPGVSELLTRNDQGEPRRWELHVSYDYAGPEPGVWDGTGTWQLVKSGELDLLDDRLGFRFTGKDPNSWSIGEGSVVTAGVLRNVEQTATPGTTTGPRPRFRLTCCVDADQGLGVSVNRRVATPTDFTITRHVDARDRFRKRVVSRWSYLSGTVGTADTTESDDTTEATAHARGVQRSREAGVFAGTATIPRLSTAYDVGDSIRSIDGRSVSLRGNAAAEAGEAPVYPTVVAVSYDLDGRQVTTLELSDRRGEPPPERRRRDRG